MTKLKRTAMQQALEALEELHYSSGTVKADQLFYSAFASLREALEQPVSQEPVAWRVRGYSQFKTGNPAPWRYVDGTNKPMVNKPDCCDFEPLYTAPQPDMNLNCKSVQKRLATSWGYVLPAKEVELTDDEITNAWESMGRGLGKYTDFARAVIAKFKEKNNANNNS